MSDDQVATAMANKKTPSGQSIVEEMVMTVCVPFHIGGKGDDRSLKKTVAWLSNYGSKWQEQKPPIGTAPFKDEESAWDAMRQYQARAYFHPFVRRFLFNPERVTRLARHDIATLKFQRLAWDAHKQEDSPWEVVLDVGRCALYLFEPDIGVLLLEVRNRAQQSLTVAQVQNLQDELRRLYPPYFDAFPGGRANELTKWKSGHCPSLVELCDASGATLARTNNFREETDSKGAPKSFFKWLEPLLRSGESPEYPWADHWRFLLSPFATDAQSKSGDTPLVRQFGDDRAQLMTWLAVEDTTNVNEGDWARLVFADNEGSAPYPYAKQFLDKFESDYCYDRFWYKGPTVDNGMSPSRILNAGYTFVFAGNADDSAFFCNKKNGALPIFRNIYVEMGAVAHFQKAALLAASERLTRMAKRDDAGRLLLSDADEVQRFYEHFIEFTQNYWFDEISPQEQGREMFAMWRRHLGVQELYNEVRQELKDLVDYTSMKADKQANNESDKLNRQVYKFGAASLFLAALSLIVSGFSMNNSYFAKADSLNGIVRDLLESSLPIWLSAFAIAIGIAALGLTGRYLKSSSPKNQPSFRAKHPNQE